MVGFLDFTSEGDFLCAKKAELAQSNGPAKIKRKPKAAPENPWANLDQGDSNLINEDDLMKKGE